MSQKTFHAGDRVLVLDPVFDPVVQYGEIIDDKNEEREVRFADDPFDPEQSGGRTVTVHPNQLFETDADILDELPDEPESEDVYRAIGMEDLIGGE